MMIIAVAGLLANILAFWILHRGSEERNLNVRPPLFMCWGIYSVRLGPLLPQS